MRLSKIRVCGTNEELYGVQGFHQDDTRFLSLTLIGRSKSCKDYVIRTEDHLEKVQITYDSSGINYFKALTNEGVTIERGQPKSFDKEYIA